MTRRQRPKGGFRRERLSLLRRQAEALEAIAAAVDRYNALHPPEPGGVRGAAGHGPPLPATERATRRGGL